MAKELAPNLEVIPGYRLVRYLGRGGFGEVWETQAPGGISKAVKLALLEAGTDINNCRELQGLHQIKAIRHPFLLSIERFDVVGDYLVIIMELADKSLADRYDECIGAGKDGIPREELLGYMREAAEALDVLNHRFGLQHLDVKPENLFLCGGHVKVADFGLVQPRNTQLAGSSIAISPPYAPPELFDGQVEPTADQYGLAVTYQELLTGTRPYSASDIRGLVMQHLKGSPDLSRVPSGDRPILQRAYSRDVAGRYTRCAEMVDALTKVLVFGSPHRDGRTEAARGPLGRSKTEPVRKPTDTEKITVRRMFTAAAAPPLPAPAAVAHHKTTVFVKGRSAETRTAAEFPPDDDGEDHLRDTFVAFLPIEIFAHKLRGFIDALEAEIVCCDDDKTVLRLAERGLFGFRELQSIFVQLDTFSRDPHSGFRVVDARIWSAHKELQGRALVRRGKLILRYLKSFLMADGALRAPVSAAKIKADIFN